MNISYRFKHFTQLTNTAKVISQTLVEKHKNSRNLWEPGNVRNLFLNKMH